jgi:hypothetical protein
MPQPVVRVRTLRYRLSGGNRTYSNRGDLCEEYADLRKSINESRARPPLPPQNDPKPRSKRFLTTADIDEIGRRYEAGETTQQIGNRYGIYKTRVATVLREQGVIIRRQGLNDEQVSEATTLYPAGRSLAWLGARYNVSDNGRHGNPARGLPVAAAARLDLTLNPR